MPKFPSPVVTSARAMVVIVSAGLVLSMVFACGRDDSLRRGSMFIEAGMYSEAVPVLRQAIQSKPNDPGAHLLLGTALLGAGAIPSAEEAFGRATLLDPKVSDQIGDAYYRVGSVYLQRSDHPLISQGNALLRTATKKNPKLIAQASDLLTARGFALAEQDPSLAHTLLSAAQEAKPDLAKDEKVQLTLALTSGDIDQKKGRLETFVARFPTSDRLPRAFFELANCYYTQNRSDDAITRLEYLVAHFPDAAEASRAKEMLSRITGERDELRRVETERVAGLAREEQLRMEAERQAAIEHSRLKVQEEQARAEAKRKRQETQAERAKRKAEWSALTEEEKLAWMATAGGPYHVRAFNADDGARILANGQTVAKTGFGEDSGWVGIDQYLQPGTNTVTFIVDNTRGAITFGFKLRGSRGFYFDADCGEAGSWGCDNNKTQPIGEAYRKDYTLTID